MELQDFSSLWCLERLGFAYWMTWIWVKVKHDNKVFPPNWPLLFFLCFLLAVSLLSLFIAILIFPISLAHLSFISYPSVHLPLFLPLCYFLLCPLPPPPLLLCRLYLHVPFLPGGLWVCMNRPADDQLSISSHKSIDLIPQSSHKTTLTSLSALQLSFVPGALGKSKALWVCSELNCVCEMFKSCPKIRAV